MSPESPSTSVGIVAAAAVGCAAGLLVADRLSREARQALALVLMAGGAAAAGPAIVRAVDHVFNHPASERGSGRRLNTIRDAGVPEEEGIYDER